MNWKLKENVRMNKVCSTCMYGSRLMADESVELCLKDIDTGDDDTYSPKLSPRIKTCLDYCCEESIESYE